MKLESALSSPSPSKRMRHFFWVHPEWWSIALSVMAWGIMLLQGIPQAFMRHTHSHGVASFQLEFLNWSLMIVAMMVPIMLEPLRWVAFRSFRQRRHQAILSFLVGFLLPWLMVGIVSSWILVFGRSHSPHLASALFALAALWLLVPVRMRALVYCHLTVPLAPLGWKADRDCLWYGIRIGVSCVATCYFLMLACAFTSHDPIAMLGGLTLGLIERRSFRPPTWRIFVGMILLALWFLLPII